MALEQLSLSRTAVDDGVTNGVEHHRQGFVDGGGAAGGGGGGGDDGCKAPRLPRWTRQEILVLIQGKRVAENRVRRGRAAGMAFGSGQVEPKWASVSSYCKRHGVNRGPVQCRKRWSNLAGDYKKIKEWESSQAARDSGGTESFWVMRNDLRRERKLPGFFDREVYDILDGATPDTAAAAIEVDSVANEGPAGLALALSTVNAAVAVDESAEDAEAVFDSGRSAAAEDGLFSDFEQDETVGSLEKESAAAATTTAKPISATMPISEKQYQPTQQGCHGQGGTNETQPVTNPELGSTSKDGRKRKRFVADGEEDNSNMQHQLVEILERNGKMLTAQLEAQNNNFKLDREQRKDQGDSLITVLNKLADALGRIADKL